MFGITRCDCILKIGGILQPLYLQIGVFSFHHKSQEKSTFQYVMIFHLSYVDTCSATCIWWAGHPMHHAGLSTGVLRLVHCMYCIMAVHIWHRQSTQERSFCTQSPPWLCFSTCQGESLTKQWTYGPTLLPWFDHFHTSLACLTAL